MSATIAKDFINAQHATFKSINESFPALSMGDHFLGYEAANLVWDTLYVLADIRLIMDEAHTMDEMMALLEEMREEYTRGAIPSGCRVEKNVVDVINRIIRAVTDLYRES